MLWPDQCSFAGNRFTDEQSFSNWLQEQVSHDTQVTPSCMVTVVNLFPWNNVYKFGNGTSLE